MVVVKYPGDKGGEEVAFGVTRDAYFPKNTMILSRRGTLELRVHWFYFHERFQLLSPTLIQFCNRIRSFGMLGTFKCFGIFIIHALIMYITLH